MLAFVVMIVEPTKRGLPLLMRESNCTGEKNKGKDKKNKYDVSCEEDRSG